MRPAIVISADRLPVEEVERLVQAHFGNMVKLVVDVSRGVAAVGGELHADAEAVLLEDGSVQADLWGANYYPGRGAESCLEYTALINIRPAQENPGMEIQNPAIRVQVREVAMRVLGEGEALA